MIDGGLLVGERLELGSRAPDEAFEVRKKFLAQLDSVPANVVEGHLTGREQEREQ